MKDKNCNIFHTLVCHITHLHTNSALNYPQSSALHGQFFSTLCVMTQESVVSLMSIFKITNFSALTGRPQTRSTAPWKL